MENLEHLSLPEESEGAPSQGLLLSSVQNGPNPIEHEQLLGHEPQRNSLMTNI